jgi:hypothetical protein
MSAERFFSGRQLIIATRHNKNLFIAPMLAERLKIQSFTPADLDTDAFGTFSGEVERLQSPVEVARSKCELAMDKYGYDLALASEGSFGPHPEIGFLPLNQELLLLSDKKNKREYVIRHHSLNTNFSASLISTEQELQHFSEAALFPSHALILRKNKEEPLAITKGIVSPDQLTSVFRDLLSRFGQVYVETDMRALYNPTRMSVIQEATEKLIQLLQSCCPSCKSPGYAIVEAIAGLPCSQCGSATRSTLAHLFRCADCQYEEHKKYPQQKQVEDPGYCNYCNP